MRKTLNKQLTDEESTDKKYVRTEINNKWILNSLYYITFPNEYYEHLF